MLKEQKINGVVIVAQTTYYVYESEEKRENDEFYLCTSDAKKIRRLKKQLKEAMIVYSEVRKRLLPQ